MAFLKKRADFLALREAARAPTPSFLAVMRCRNDNDPTIRIGFTVTRKVGKAVMRNRIRRRLRAAARAVVLQNGQAGCDYALIARAAAHDRAYGDLLDDLRRALLSLARRAT